MFSGLSKTDVPPFTEVGAKVLVMVIFSGWGVFFCFFVVFFFGGGGGGAGGCISNELIN